MKILLVTTDYLPNVSGIATLSHEQAAGLAQLGHQVRVLTSTAAGGQVTDEKNLVIQRIENPMPPVLRLGQFFQTLSATVKQWQPDFIWCTNYRGFGLPVMRVGRSRRIPYGIYFHGTELITENKSRLRRTIITSVARHAAVVCTNSKNSAQILTDNFGVHGNVATPGVHEPPLSTQAFLAEAQAQRASWFKEKGIDPDLEPVVFIAACRISQQKGLHTVIEAIASLRQAVRQNLLFVAVGSGPDLDNLRQLASKLDVEQHVIFAGPAPRERISVLLQAADVYLQPSQPEGDFLESFGISFLEAQAMGLPSIATRWGGIPEAVRDGITAKLVPPKSVKAVAEAMMALLNDIEWRKRAAAEARSWAAQNSWKKHVITIDSLLGTTEPTRNYE